MGGALVFEVHSAAYSRKIMLVKSMGPTAQMIVGGVKHFLKTKYSLQTLNPVHMNLNLKPNTVNPQPWTLNTKL